MIKFESRPTVITIPKWLNVSIFDSGHRKIKLTIQWILFYKW
jgi:hypothetical protein